MVAGRDQVWTLYLDTLPEDPPCPTFDFTEEDLIACRGTYLRDLILDGREEFEKIMAGLIRPILKRYQQQDKYSHKNLEQAFRSAWALQATRAFEPVEGGSVMLPIVDCFNGQVEGGSNTCMFNTEQVGCSRGKKRQKALEKLRLTCPFP